MAPNGLAQQKVLHRAASRIKCNSLSSVECHGTGTQLGDPIEMSSVRQVLSKLRQDSVVCVGALKSNIGHTEYTSGTAGVVKLILCMELSTAYPNLSLAKPNRLLELDTFALGILPSQVSQCQFKYNTVSSFGFSGTNAVALLACGTVISQTHLVVSYQPTQFGWWDACDTVAVQGLLHPLLGQAEVLEGVPALKRWQKAWPLSVCNHMSQHRVGCTSLAPGTGYLEMAREAVTCSDADTDSLSITSTQFTSILFLDDKVRPLLQLTLDLDFHNITVESIDSTGAVLQHAIISVSSKSDSPFTPALALPSQTPATFVVNHVDGSSFYAATGNDYRGDFRSLRTVGYTDESLLVKLEFEQTRPDGLLFPEHQHLRNAAVVDACGQPAVLRDWNHEGRPYVFGGLDWCWLSAQRSAENHVVMGRHYPNGSFAVFDSNEAVRCHLSAASQSFLQPGKLEWQHSRQETIPNSLWTVQWTRADQSAKWPESSCCMTDSDFCSSSNLPVCELPSSRVLYVGALESGISAVDACRDVIQLTQIVLESGASIAPILAVLTSGSQIVGKEINVAADWQLGFLWGMVRSIKNEHPELQMCCIDVSTANCYTEQSRGQQDETVWRSDQGYNRHLVMSESALAPTPCSGTMSPTIGEPRTLMQKVAARLYSQSVNHAVDVQRFSRIVTAQEALARDYLRLALNSISKQEVAGWHINLWNRWYHKLQVAATSKPMSYAEIVNMYPEVATSLAMLSRCSFHTGSGC